MTLNEKRQLTNYIKGLVRESIYGDDVLNDFNNGTPEILQTARDEYPDGVVAINPEEGSEEGKNEKNIAGLNELRNLTESMARSAVKNYLMEKKKGGKKSSKKKGSSSEKTNSSEKTIVSRLNNDAVNSAHYFYKLYGVEDGTEDEKAAARSLGYKKAKGKKLPGKKGHYKFSSKERNRLNAMLTTDKN